MKDLTKGNVYKNFLVFALPLVLSGVLSMSIEFIDKAVVGRFMGEKSLAAMSAVTPLLTFCSSVLWGYYTGCSIYVARLFGERNYQKIKSTVYAALLGALVIGGCLSLLMVVFHNPVFAALNVKEELRSDALRYYLIRASALLVVTLPVFGTSLMAALGVSAFTFLASMTAALVSLLGDIASALWLGWGLVGVATFGALGSAVSIVMYYGKLRVCFREMGVEKERVKLGFSPLKAAALYILPTMIQQGILYIPDVAIAPVVNGIGTQALAGYAVASTVMNFCITVFQNSTKVVGNYVAQCVGEKKYNKIDKGVGVGLMQSTLLSLPFLLVGVFFAEGLCSLFLEKDASPLTKEYTYLFCRRYMPFVWFSLVDNLFHALYRGSKASAHLLSVTCVGATSKIALTYALQSRGIRGYYLAIVLAWGIEAAFAVTLYCLGRWRPERREQTEEAKP